MTDEEKLRYTQDAFIRKIQGIQTWIQFKTLLNAVTKQQVVNFIKANLQQNATSYRDSATGMTTKADDIDLLVGEVDAI